MSKTNTDGGADEEGYSPAILTAGDDQEINLKFRDERIKESEHVMMPDPPERRCEQDPDSITNMETTNPSGTPTESIVTIVNPETDSLSIELEFYDETMEGVEGVTMPDPPEDG